jgi:hypothetical protein
LKNNNFQIITMILSIVIPISIIFSIDSIIGLFPQTWIKFILFIFILALINPIIVVLQNTKKITWLNFIKLYTKEIIEMILIIILHLLMIPGMAFGITVIIAAMLTVVLIILTVLWIIKFPLGLGGPSGIMRADINFYTIALSISIFSFTIGYLISRYKKNKDFSFMDLYSHIEGPIMNFIAKYLSIDKDKKPRQTYKKKY